MIELTYSDLEERGIDTSNIAVCKKLRNLAKLDRIKLDDTTHRSGLNKHLFDYIEYCDLDVLTFVKQYLSNLQPYMIERRKDQEPDKSFICVVDNLYRISVYIKVNNKQFEEVIVSFHEDNKRGIAKTNDLIRGNLNKYVAIFADSILSKIEGENKYIVKAFFQRGLQILPLELPAVKCKNIFIVERKAIDLQFISYCNDYIRDLYTSDLKLDFDNIEVFSVLQQISFTSYGKDTFSSISLLIDSLCIQNDYISKSVADAALVTFAQSLQLTTDQQDELKELLDKKYVVTSIKGIDIILQRVKENISLKYNLELDE
jgi:hypothetical protein